MKEAVKASPQVKSGPTFLVKVHSCQDGNWHGKIQWLEEEKSVNFKSSLEMIMLIQDSVEKFSPEVKKDIQKHWVLSK